MTRRRWIADEYTAGTAALTGAHAAHLARVLRASAGESCDVSAGGSVRHAVITSVTEQRVEFSLGEAVEGCALHPVTMVLAIFKFDRYEWAVEKCTELGADRILPLISRRSDAHLAQAAAKRTERWNRIAAQASEQSRRVTPPEILAPMRLKALLAGNSPVAGHARIVLAENESMVQLLDLLDGNQPQPVALAVGPEGGWSDEELAMMDEAGWRRASLGPTILRAETAAVASLAVARAALL
jgi:16S rRNA (uracil1498-N3)-methyltransferase